MTRRKPFHLLHLSGSNQMRISDLICPYTFQIETTQNVTMMDKPCTPHEPVSNPLQ